MKSPSHLRHSTIQWRLGLSRVRTSEAQWGFYGLRSLRGKGNTVASETGRGQASPANLEKDQIGCVASFRTNRHSPICAADARHRRTPERRLQGDRRFRNLHVLRNNDSRRKDFYAWPDDGRQRSSSQQVWCLRNLHRKTNSHRRGSRKTQAPDVCSSSQNRH